MLQNLTAHNLGCSVTHWISGASPNWGCASLTKSAWAIFSFALRRRRSFGWRTPVALPPLSILKNRKILNWLRFGGFPSSKHWQDFRESSSSRSVRVCLAPRAWSRPSCSASICQAWLTQTILANHVTKSNPKTSSIGRQGDGSWATGGLKEYPPAFSKALAEQFWCAISAVPSNAQEDPDPQFLSVCKAMTVTSFTVEYGRDFAGWLPQPFEFMIDAATKVPKGRCKKKNMWGFPKLPKKNFPNCQKKSQKQKIFPTCQTSQKNIGWFWGYTQMCFGLSSRLKDFWIKPVDYPFHIVFKILLLVKSANIYIYIYVLAFCCGDPTLRTSHIEPRLNIDSTTL